MNISDFTTDANTLEQQIIDVKAYALANYNARGWDFIIETLTDAELGAVIGKRKNSRAAINAAYAYIKPLFAARGPLASAHQATTSVDVAIVNATVDNDIIVDHDVPEVQDPAAARRARRTASQKARREAARAAKL